MKNLVYQQINEVLASSAERRRLTSESALRVGAATLLNSPAISATTIVCDVPADDLDGFEELVADIADEYGIDARVREASGSYVVRFTMLPVLPLQVERKPTLKSKLARLFAPEGPIFR